VLSQRCGDLQEALRRSQAENSGLGKALAASEVGRWTASDSVGLRSRNHPLPLFLSYHRFCRLYRITKTPGLRFVGDEILDCHSGFWSVTHGGLDVCSGFVGYGGLVSVLVRRRSGRRASRPLRRRAPPTR
jgi:hypothetical protein